MKEKKKNISQKLPVYSPSERVWTIITDNLDSNTSTSNIELLNDKLPKYKAPGTSWENIENRLHKNKTRYLFFYSAKIAAVFILLLGISFVIKSFLSNDFDDYKISYEVAYTYDSEEDIIPDLNNKIELKKLIADKCKQDPTTCGNEDFIELYNLLNKLEKEEILLNEQLRIFKDTEIKNNLIKIENEKAKIEKYMIEMFNN